MAILKFNYMFYDEARQSTQRQNIKELASHDLAS